MAIPRRGGGGGGTSGVTTDVATPDVLTVALMGVTQRKALAPR